MAIAPQYNHGATRPVEASFDTSDTTVTIAIGDMVIQTSGNVAPIGSGTVTTSFLGVAAQKKPAGVTGTALRLFGNSKDGVIRVDTDGEFTYDCDDTMALVVGDFMGPNGSQKVKKVASETISVGRVAKPMAASAGRVTIKIQSAVFPAAKTT